MKTSTAERLCIIGFVLVIASVISALCFSGITIEHPVRQLIVLAALLGLIFLVAGLVGASLPRKNTRVFSFILLLAFGLAMGSCTQRGCPAYSSTPSYVNLNKLPR